MGCSITRIMSELDELRDLQLKIFLRNSQGDISSDFKYYMVNRLTELLILYFQLFINRFDLDTLKIILEKENCILFQDLKIKRKNGKSLTVAFVDNLISKLEVAMIDDLKVSTTLESPRIYGRKYNELYKYLIGVNTEYSPYALLSTAYPVYSDISEFRADFLTRILSDKSKFNIFEIQVFQGVLRKKLFLALSIYKENSESILDILKILSKLLGYNFNYPKAIQSMITEIHEQFNDKSDFIIGFTKDEGLIYNAKITKKGIQQLITLYDLEDI